MMDDHLMVISTCNDQATARQIARTLVEQSLAACVNIVPGIESVYRWNKQIESDTEYLMLIKTRASQYQQLETRLVALHPYELPEVIAVSLEQGFKPYLDWISEATRQHNENKR